MTASEIQQEIDRTRERLGETVEELAAKADVKARAKEKAVEIKAKAQGRATEVSGLVKDKAAGVSGRVKKSPLMQRRWPAAAAAAAGVLAAGIVVWRWRRT